MTNTGTFLPTAQEAALFAALRDRADDFCEEIAQAFDDIGSYQMAAASLAASLLLEAAWKRAALTRIFVGGEPDIGNFIACAAEAATGITFDIPAIREAMASTLSAEDAE